MITHKNLVDAVYRSIDPWACPGEDCPDDHGCRECAERLVTEYENSLRADEHDKEVVRKFVEHLRIKYHVDVSENLEWYEKEQKEGENNG